jgi:hypothetical protein
LLDFIAVNSMGEVMRRYFIPTVLKHPHGSGIDGMSVFFIADATGFDIDPV